eukprot:s3238_g12.t1
MEGSKWHAKKESVYYQAGDAGEGYSEDWQSDWGPAYYEEPDDEGKRVRPGPSFILLLLWSAIHRHHHHPGQSPRKGRKGKGHGRKGGSGKGKQGPLPLGAGGKAAARGRAANVGRQVCLRCGVAGHWARYCPSAATDKKRKLEGAEDEVMMVSEVTLDDTCKDTKVAVFAMDCDDNDDDTQVCTTVQDGGAASVLGSMLHVRRYLRSLLELGYNLDEIGVFQCKKRFRYGNSETEATRLCLLLPAVPGGRKMKILAYVVKGSCPLLFGRPLLERLGITVGYQLGRLLLPGRVAKDRARTEGQGSDRPFDARRLGDACECRDQCGHPGARRTPMCLQRMTRSRMGTARTQASGRPLQCPTTRAMTVQIAVTMTLEMCTTTWTMTMQTVLAMTLEMCTTLWSTQIR